MCCVLRHTHVTAIESVHIRAQLFRTGSLLQLWDLRAETRVFYILCHLTLCSALCLWFKMRSLSFLFLLPRLPCCYELSLWNIKQDKRFLPQVALAIVFYQSHKKSNYHRSTVMYVYESVLMKPYFVW